MIGSLIVASFGAEHAGKKIMSAGQIRLQLQSTLQYLPAAFHIAFLNGNPPQVHPTIRIAGIDSGDLLEGLLSGLKIPLKKEPDSIIVPARPVARLKIHFWRNGRRSAGKYTDDDLVFGQ